MTADLMPFDYDGRPVRTVLVDGEPWFVLADLCAVLGLTSPTRVAERLDPDGVSQAQVIDSMGRTQSATVVNEAGMYEVVIRSDKPQAVAFRRWIAGTVLPQIRRTGSFNVKELTRADMARMILAAEEELAIVSAALASAAPAIAYHDRYVAESADVVVVKVWGAQFGLTEAQAFDLLKDRKIIYRISLGVRWSNKAGKKVEEFEYRARAGRQSFAWFDLLPQHNAPRHHNGQVRQTLYVRQAYALDLGRACGLVPVSTSGVGTSAADQREAAS